MDARTRRERRLFPLVALVALVVAMVLLGSWVVRLVNKSVPDVSPLADQCTVKVGDVGDSLDLEQSQNAAVIVAESIRRGLAPRAASIALATAMQESKLRNIDYGDRDSVGLFQQRPSQGWGTRAEILNPWYASGKFYDALVKVPNWQNGDLNDVAQTVQKSGVPQGYRDHVDAAKAWASALTGHSPAAVTCKNGGTGATSASSGTDLVAKAWPGGSVKASQGQSVVTLNAASSTNLWAATQLFLMTTGKTGVTRVVVGPQTWQSADNTLPPWQGTASGKATEATISLRS